MELTQYLQLAVNGGMAVVVAWLVYHVFTKLIPDRDRVIDAIAERFSAEQAANRAAFESSLKQVVAHCSEEAALLNNRHAAESQLTFDRFEKILERRGTV